VIWIKISSSHTFYNCYYVHYSSINQLFVCFWRNSPQWAMASSFTRFLYQKQRRSTVGRTLPDEWSARRRDLYLTTHNNHNRQTSMIPVVFEPTISIGEWPQTYALDRAADTGTCVCVYIYIYIYKLINIYEPTNAVNYTYMIWIIKIYF
jgi:hypothetical protein